MPYDVTLIPGDGTGPEITEATRRVLEATGVEFRWHVKQAGLAVFEQYHTVLPEDVIESIKETKIGLKGPITTPVGKAFLQCCGDGGELGEEVVAKLLVECGAQVFIA